MPCIVEIAEKGIAVIWTIKCSQLKVLYKAVVAAPTTVEKTSFGL